MKNKVILFLTFIAMGIIGASLLIYPSIFELKAEIIHRISPELGREIVIFFNQPVIRTSFEKHFNSEIEWEFIWFDSNQELHIIPKEELKDDMTYRLSLEGFRSFALTRLKKKSFSFYLPSTKSISAPNLEPQKLPLGGDAFFKKLSGDLVEINKAQIAQGKYIDIDLSKMILTIFNNSQLMAIYDVAAIGSPWGWPTPKGKFRVLHKEENHFSRKTFVWMPWSIHFYGDYYIHEIPYWPNGQKVTSKYSGGCVRLPEDSAKSVYDLAEIGIPVLVH